MAVLWSWVGTLQPCQDMTLLIRRFLWLFYLFTFPYYCTLFRRFSCHPVQVIFSISPAAFASMRYKLMLNYVPVLSATKKPSPSSFSGGCCIINSLSYMHKTHGLVLKTFLERMPGMSVGHVAVVHPWAGQGQRSCCPGAAAAACCGCWDSAPG